MVVHTKISPINGFQHKDLRILGFSVKNPQSAIRNPQSYFLDKTYLFSQFFINKFRTPKIIDCDPKIFDFCPAQHILENLKFLDLPPKPSHKPPPAHVQPQLALHSRVAHTLLFLSSTRPKLLK